jgi:hypothetical protein
MQAKDRQDRGGERHSVMGRVIRLAKRLQPGWNPVQTTDIAGWGKRVRVSPGNRRKGSLPRRSAT